LVAFLPLGSGSVDPHIFADPVRGSQNIANPTDLDSKHWYKIQLLKYKDILHDLLTFYQKVS